MATGEHGSDHRQKPGDRREEGLSQWDEGPSPTPPEPFNMAEYCLAAATRTPDKIALEVYTGLDQPPELWTFRALADAVAKASGGLAAAGVSPGDRVALRLGPTARFPIFFFGAVSLGAVAVPLATGLSAAEARAIAAAIEPSLVLLEQGDAAADAFAADGWRTVVGGALDGLADGAPTPPLATARDAPATLVFTSGSSGKPKGVLHAHRAAHARRMMWEDWYGLRPSDRLLHAGALNWTYTLGAGLTDPWAAGATAIVWSGAAGPDLWPQLAETARPTLFAATPAHYRRILKYGDQLRSRFATVRAGLSAGEALAPEIRAAWTAATGAPLHEALGMSECSTFISGSDRSPAPTGCSGYPQRGRAIAVLPQAGADTVPVPLGEVGVLSVHRRDPGLTLGYWRDAAADQAAQRGDWFLTGDLVTMRADGAIAHVGRADDQMNAQGFRVAPQEIEAALGDTPGVMELAAAETSVDTGLSIITLFVSPAHEADPTALRAALMARAEARLADYKRPRAIRFVEALPRSANGKLLRRRLRETAPET